MSDTDSADQRKRGRLTPLSIDDLDPKETLRAFMQVDPEKVKGRLQEGGRSRQQGDEE